MSFMLGEKFINYMNKCIKVPAISPFFLAYYYKITHCHNSCGFMGVSISAFCHTRNNIKCVLSRAVNDVRKCFSVLVVNSIAFGITFATFSLPL